MAADAQVSAAFIILEERGSSVLQIAEPMLYLTSYNKG